MARDPLAMLARLRLTQVAAAQREMGTRRAEADAAAARAAAAAQALLAEGAAAPADYAAFLPRARAERDAAVSATQRAEAALELARTGLAEARTAERAVQEVAAQGRAAARKKARQREQALIDDWAPRPL
jgi:flagellar biosynthesis chaperone FliJ